MYAAISEGFFKDEGLNIDFSTGEGADKTMQQVLSKNADIGFCGPEQVIYMDKNTDILNKFTRAIYRGQLWISNHTDAEVAKSIKSFFPGTDEQILINIIKK